jgi:hypothetical protein
VVRPVPSDRPDHQGARRDLRRPGEDRQATILAIKNGQVVQQITGARPKADFETMAKDLLS